MAEDSLKRAGGRHDTVSESREALGCIPRGVAAGGARMRYSFDDYTLDPGHYELRQVGRLVQLAPRVFDLLAHLVKHSGLVVTNEELKEQLWPGSVVGEASLANAVAQARKAL